MTAQRTLPIESSVVVRLPSATVPLAGLTPEQRWAAAHQTAERLALPPSQTLVFVRLCWLDATSSHAVETVPQLAAATGLSAATVVRALAALRELDLVVTRRDRGGAVRSVHIPKPIYDDVRAGRLNP